MKKPAISIIVPVYQAEKTIVRCIDSILAQIFGDYEVLLVDDGSSDESPAILKEYSNMDQRIRVLTQKNGGAASARNKALEYIQGEYVAFLDSDDWWDYKALARMMETALNTNADIVQCKFCYASPNGLTYEPKDVFPDGSFFTRDQFPKTVYKKMMVGIQLNHVHHTLYKASLLHGLRMEEHMRTGEDLMYNMQVYPRANNYTYIAEPLYYYYRRADGLTGSSLSLSDKLRYNWLISIKMHEMLPAWNMDSIGYHIKVSMRQVFLIISKIYRMMRNLLMRIGIGKTQISFEE